MHKFFVDPPCIGQDSINITGDDAHHISRVLRLKEDDEIIVCDKCGTDYYCSIKSISKDEVVVWILRKEFSPNEPPIEIILYQGVPKGDKLETVIQKSVELGVSKVVPVAMKRCVAIIKDKDKKTKRLQRVAYEAAKQCGRAKIPEVGDVLSFKDALESCADCDLKLLPYEAEGKNSLKETLTQNSSSKKIAILIGPEGGFDETEVELAKDMGFESITLGPRIMRTETAPIACIAAVMYELGDW